MTRVRSKTFVWRDVARSDSPRAVPRARHGTETRYKKHGCRCVSCRKAHRSVQVAYRERRHAREVAERISNGLPVRVHTPEGEFRTIFFTNPIIAWRIARWARRYEVTKTQAMDIIINRLLDDAEPRYVYLQGAA